MLVVLLVFLGLAALACGFEDPLFPRSTLPAPMPMPPGTPVRLPEAPISPENSGQLQELARRGLGQASRAWWTPDGQWLLVQSDYFRLDWYDARAYALTRTFAVDGEPFAASGDGELIAVRGYHTTTLRLVETATGAERTRIDLAAEGDAIGEMAFDAGGSLLALAMPEWVVVFDTAVGKVVRRVTVAHPESEPTATPGGRYGGVSALSFSPDGAVLLVESGRRQLEAWDTRTWQALYAMPFDGFHEQAVFSGDGQRLAVTDEDGWEIYAAATGERLTGVKADLGEFGSLAAALSPDGSRLALCFYSGAVVYDATTGAALATLSTAGPGGTYTGGSIAYSPDGRRMAAVAATGGDHVVRVWSSTGAFWTALAGYQAQVLALAFLPDGTLATADWDGIVRLWDAAGGRERPALRSQSEDLIESLVLSPDGAMLATGQREWSAWDTRTGQAVEKWGGFDGPPPGELVGFVPGMERLIRYGNDCRLEMLDLNSGKTVRRYDTGQGADCHGKARLSPDARLLAAGVAATHEIAVWDVESGELRAKFAAGTGDVYFVDFSFSADGGLLAVVYGRTAVLWDMATGAEHARISGEERLTGAHAFSPDGRLLALGVDGGIVLWDVADGREAGRLDLGPVRVMALAFSADGTLLTAAGNDGIVRLWGVP